MNYKEVLSFLMNNLPMYQRQGKTAYKANLDTTHKLDEYFQHPHKNYKSIHIAGTNGKGSVSHMLASVLHEQGYKTGLYTSPHMTDFRERIKINGEMVTERFVMEFIHSHYDVFTKHKPSFFEMTFAMATVYFKEEKVDFAIFETGMGGRLDSTNIITPVLSIITNIGLDHTQFLGETIAKIAGEKAGIIKKDVPIVISEKQDDTMPVFKETAKQKQSPLYFAEDIYQCHYSMITLDGLQELNVYNGGELIFPKLQLDLTGQYQVKNCMCVLSAIQILQSLHYTICSESIYKGLAKTVSNTGLLGRWQVLGHSPKIICDTAHNISGITEIVNQLEQTPHKDLHFILGFVNDKLIDDIIVLLPRSAHYYFTRASVPRAMDENELKDIAQKKGLQGDVYTDPKNALLAAKQNAEEHDIIFITGSTFVVADILS